MLKRWIILLGVVIGAGLLGMVLDSGAVSAEINTACTSPASIPTPILAMVVLAFDNDPDPLNELNLTPKYATTLDSLIAATAVNGDLRVVVIGDRDRDADTELLTIANGVVNQVNCLPISDGSLSGNVDEWDSTDGDLLGGFITWSRTTYPAAKTIFSYVGHGTFLAPAVDPSLSAIISPTQLLRQKNQPTALSPLPINVDANPNFTDNHAPTNGQIALITPHALAVALKAGTNSGSNKIDVIDLVHCFAGSIEEISQLNPYTRMTTASPNYAFFDPVMLGNALGQLNAASTASQMASSVINTYHTIIPNSDHPHKLIAVDNNALNAVKTTWDGVSAGLMTSFETDLVATLAALDAAYQGSQKYDTTFCEDSTELDLAPPDALSDMLSFARLLALQPGLPLAVTDGAQQSVADISMAITASFGQNDAPWFYAGGGVAPFWGVGNTTGLSFFTPFETMLVDGKAYHTWQTLWYTDSTSYPLDTMTTLSNPYPYDFVLGVGATWADVLARYWTEKGNYPGFDVESAFCVPNLPRLRPDSAELNVSNTAPSNAIQTGDQFTAQVIINNSGFATATQVELRAQLSPLTTIFTLPAGCTFTNSILICPLPDVPVNQTVIFDYAVTALSPGTAINTALVKSLQYEPDLANNIATHSAFIMGTPLAVGLGSAEISPFFSLFSLLLTVNLGLGTLYILRRNC